MQAARPIARSLRLSMPLLALLLVACGGSSGTSEPGPDSVDTTTQDVVLPTPDVATAEDIVSPPNLVPDLAGHDTSLGEVVEDAGEPGEDLSEPDIPVEIPEGEDCAHAIALTPVDQTLEDTLEGHSDDHNSSCRLRSGAELVYAFTVTEETRFSALMSGLDAVLSLRAGCAGDAEMICDDDSGEEGAAWLEHIRLEPGEYRLFADSHVDQEQPFTLALSFEGSLCGPESCGEGMLCRTNEDWTDVLCTCPEGTLAHEGACVDDPCLPNPCTEAPGRTACRALLPSNYECLCNEPYFVEQEDGSCLELDPYVGENCEAPFPLAITEGTTVRPVGLPEMTGDESSWGCGGKGPDAVFAIEVAEPVYLDATARGEDSVLYVRPVCDDRPSQPEHGCNDDADPPGDHGSHLGIGLAEPGTWYLFVDDYGEEPPEEDSSLHVFFRADPCVDGGGCRADQICTRNADWTAPICVCPEGELEFEAACVDDPCDPWPCTEGDHTWCTRQLPDSYACTCRPGYLEDGFGDCVDDPDGAAWTVMVFLNADNNLEDDGLFDVHDEMTLVGSSDAVNVVVQLDTLSDETRRYYVTPGQAVEVGDPLGEVNMGDWREMARFGNWAIENYPARHYAFILWNHGSGWHKSARIPEPEDAGWKSFSTDDTSPGWRISIAEGHYAQALTEVLRTNGGQRLDIVSFDACLMGMWEVAHASVPYADYFVASEANIPSTGFAYDGFLAPLVADPTLGPADVATWIVQSYQEAREANATLSAVDLAQMAPVDEALSALGSALLANPEVYESLLGIYTELPWYTVRYTDARALAQFLESETSLPQSVRDAAAELRDAVDTAVFANGTNGLLHERSYGLSVYLTAENYDEDYDDAPWSLVTLWDDFLRDFSAEEEPAE